MKRPGFWIERHPFPDKIILDRGRIEALNDRIRGILRLTNDLAALRSPYPGGEVRVGLENEMDRLSNRSLWLRSGKRAGPRFYRNMSHAVNIQAIPDAIETRYGLIVRYADQRLLPTREGLFSKPGDLDFDALQNSALDVGTPLAVLHESADGEWYFVVAPLSSGWVEGEKVALCSESRFREYLNPLRFVVVTRAKGDIYLDRSLTDFHDSARMGARLLLRQMGPEVVAVCIPLRREDGTLSEGIGYVRGQAVCRGYLPYTPRTILEQSFELLNYPYGWGGMYGEQDCSRFIQEVFATVGIRLPRNSADQARVGYSVGSFRAAASETEKLHILYRQAVAGLTLLCLKGHIMLFVGMHNDRPYAIHSIWAYREPPAPCQSPIRVINRVALTDLFLGEGSRSGSLLKRLRRIRIIAPTDRLR